MGREASPHADILPEHVESYLARRGYAEPKVTSMSPLGTETQEGLKGYGYGRPLMIRFASGGEEEVVVLRTMSPDPFGHQYRCDRAAAMLLSYDTFARIPQHVQPLDVGVFDPNGTMQSVGEGEFFLLTTFLEGELYAQELKSLAELEKAPVDALKRVEILADYLSELHSEVVEPKRYARAIRDLFGAGEGVLGQTDNFRTDSVVDRDRLKGVEHAFVEWRWKMRDNSDRCRRTHGDFHPFNLLFDDKDTLSVLDCSRGACGDPADDVTCLAINFLFFGFASSGRFSGALHDAWTTFWKRYTARSGAEVLAFVAPFFAWRSLVLVNPVWYPDVPASSRDRLLGFAESLLGGTPFEPDAVSELLGGGAGKG